MTMDEPNFSGTMDPNTDTNKNIDHQEDDVVDPLASKLSEDDSRRMILESYEKAGVDLPLVTLETVLDREISEDDARQTGAPRFRKFLNKASSVMANRALNSKKIQLEEAPDDEIDLFTPPPAETMPDDTPQPEDEIAGDMPQLLSSSSYTSYSTGECEAPPAQQENTTDMHQTPERPVNNFSAIGDENAIIPQTPESAKNDCHPTFDFCCPKSSTNASPTRSCASDKYVMSNLQLAEGFDDEQQSVDVQETRDVPALMDVEDSMMENSSTIEQVEPVMKGGNNGIMDHFRGSRRFRFAILICCLLHIVLVGLIIAFVTKSDNEKFAAGSSSSAISEGQTSTGPSSSTSTTDLVTSKTLFPDPDLNKQLDVVKEDTTSDGSAESDTTPSIDETEEDNIFEETPLEEITVPVVQDDAPVPVVQEGAPVEPVETDNQASPEICMDSLEVSMNCIGEGSELLVYFESCTPLPGDWVAIYDASADPQFLLDSEAIVWLYTCGDRFCGEAVEKEVLSFTRATIMAGVGSFRAHLMREGVGPIYSSIASSSNFRIVTNANTEC